MKSVLLHACLACAAGCAKSGPTDEVPIAPTEEVAPQLVRVGKLAATQIRPRLSIWVTSHGVRVVRGVERSVHRDQMLVHANLEDANDHLIASVRDAIAGILAEAPEDQRFVAYYNNGAGRVEHAARIVVASDVPISALIDVVYSAGKAGITGYAFAVEGPDGEGAIEIVPPRFVEGDEPPVTDGPRCVLPRFVFATDGTYVNARHIAMDNGLPVQPSEAVWIGKLLIDGKSGCPSLPVDASKTIAGFTKKLAALGPACGYAIVSAEHTMTWGSIAPSLAALSGEAGLLPLVFEAEAMVVGSCDAALAL